MKARNWSLFTAACLFSLIISSTVHAQTWRAVTDADGFTWARVLLVNDSTSDSNWSISSCRTAVASDADTAEVDASLDWDGVVAAESSEYVWVYGRDISEINIANADGEASAYIGSSALTEDGDGELVIAVSADGVSSVSVEASDAYAAPVVVGGLPQ